MTQDQQLDLALQAYLWGFTDMHGMTVTRFGAIPPFHTTKFERYLYHFQRDLYDYLHAVKDEREIIEWIKSKFPSIIERIAPKVPA